MQLPHAWQAVVPRAKITDYLLAVQHPTGGSKAVLFLKHGFRREDADLLRLRLKELAIQGQVSETVSTRYGTKYVVDGSVSTPSGNRLWLRSVWITPKGQTAPRFVTAYPTPEETE